MAIFENISELINMQILQDDSGIWRHINCPHHVTSRQCTFCENVENLIVKKKTKTDVKPIDYTCVRDNETLETLLHKLEYQEPFLFGLNNRKWFLKNKIARIHLEQSQPTITDNNWQQKCKKLNVPNNQIVLIEAMITATKQTGQFSNDWLRLCWFLYKNVGSVEYNNLRFEAPFLPLVTCDKILDYLKLMENKTINSK